MKILVTGAGGQIGSDLLPMLLARGNDVAVYDLAPRPDACPPEVEWLRGDVAVSAEVFDAVKTARPDRIFHLAAILSAAGESVPHRTWHVNLDGTRYVLEAARLFDVQQVFYTSTIAVFGPGLEPPVGDDVPLHPTTMYGVTKVAGELLGEYYQQAFGLDFRGVRFPGLVSAGIPGGGTSDYALFMFVEGMRSGGYEAFCTPESRIPFMYMPDALRAMIELADAPKESLSRSVYNITAMSPTAQEIADAVRERVPGANITFESDPKRQAILDSWPTVLDDSLARRDWGWEHEYDLAGMSDDIVPKIRKLIESQGRAEGAHV